MAACIKEVAQAAQLVRLPPLKLMKSTTDRQAGGVTASAVSVGTSREVEAGQL